MTHGSHHIRYVGPKFILRLTTDAPIHLIRDETFFNLSAPADVILGRFCRMRDASFVVRALSRLAATRKVENYFRRLMNIVSSLEDIEARAGEFWGNYSMVGIVNCAVRVSHSWENAT